MDNEKYLAKTDIDNLETDDVGTQTKKVSLYAFDSTSLEKKRLTGTENGEGFGLDINTEGLATKDNQQSVIDSLDSVIDKNPETDIKEVRVYQDNYESTLNSTTTQLIAGQSFSGDWEDCSQYQEITIALFSDQDGSTDGFRIIWSDDASSSQEIDYFTFKKAYKYFTYTPNPKSKYFKIDYKNGATGTTKFKILTTLRRQSTGGTFKRISDTINDNQSGRINISIPKVKSGEDSYIDVAGTANGYPKIHLTSFEKAISTNSNTQLKATLFDSTGTEIDFSSIGGGVEWVSALGSDTADDTYYYIGSLKVGTFDWRIKRIAKSDYSVAWAEGTAVDETALASVWTNRATQTYNLSI